MNEHDQAHTRFHNALKSLLNVSEDKAKAEQPSEQLIGFLNATRAILKLYETTFPQKEPLPA